MVFNFVANAAAIASLTGVTVEAAGRGKKVGSQSADRAVAINDIKNLTGDSFLNSPSEKHNAMKKWVRGLDITTPFIKAGGAVSGFFKGAGETIKRNLPTVGFSALTLISRNRTIKTIGIVGTVVSMAYDFIKNGTNLFTNRNLIEK